MGRLTSWSRLSGSASTVRNNLAVGGFIGIDDEYGSVNNSYSGGKPNGVEGGDDLIGGFIGDNAYLVASNCYWDENTSKTHDCTGYGSAAGIIGLTTKQLKSGLPSGFNPAIWAEDKKVNSGLPYLVANPPPK